MKKINLLKDSKLNCVTEFIYNIKIIKLYSWIDTFEYKVKQARNKEVSAWYVRYLANILNMLFNTGIASLIIIGQFSVYYAHGKTMNLDDAFAALAILSKLRGPMRGLPNFLAILTEFSVSVK